MSARGDAATTSWVFRKVWDWPTRLVHWLLVALVLLSWWSAKTGHMDYHRYSGYTLLGVLMFRLYWGFFGGHTARFTQFVKGPSAIMAYLRAAPVIKSIGHNPLGALSVLVLLVLLLTQAGLGLFSVDIDGIESGPLSNLVTFDTGRILAKRHALMFNVLLAVIALHVVAIFFYLFVKRDNLIRPMIVGKKLLPSDATPTSISTPLLRVVVGLLLAAIVVWAVVR
jgi:cytochrome b